MKMILRQNTEILNYGRCGGYNTYGNLKRGGRIIDISGNKFKSFVVEDED